MTKQPIRREINEPIDTHSVVDRLQLSIMPRLNTADEIAEGLEQLAFPGERLRLSRTALRQALAVVVSVTVWDLVRLKDWRFKTSGWMTTRAIRASLNDGSTWWADHTRKEIYTASDSPDGGAYRPANYWGRLQSVVRPHSIEFKLMKWWMTEYPHVPWNKRWRQSLSRPLSAANRDLGIALASSALQIPPAVFDIHALVAALPELVSDRGAIAEIAPSEIEHIWRHLANYQQIMLQTPNLLFAFHHAAYGSGPGPWARTVQDLKIRLKDHDITEYGWRLLLRHGNRLFVPWFRSKARSASPFLMIAEALATQQVMRDGRFMPAWFISALIRAHTVECSESPIQRGWLRMSSRVLRMAAERAIPRTGKVSRELLRQDVQRIVRWGCRHGTTALDDVAIKGWKYLTATVVELTAQVIASYQTCVDKFDFVRIESIVDFANEGALLENCLGREEFRDAGKQRDLRYYSIRVKDIPVRVGVTTIYWNHVGKRWLVAKIEGPRNTKAPEELLCAAMWFATSLPELR